MACEDVWPTQRGQEWNEVQLSVPVRPAAARDALTLSCASEGQFVMNRFFGPDEVKGPV